jgi:hypothetical protein
MLIWNKAGRIFPIKPPPVILVSTFDLMIREGGAHFFLCLFQEETTAARTSSILFMPLPRRDNSCTDLYLKPFSILYPTLYPTFVEESDFRSELTIIYTYGSLFLAVVFLYTHLPPPYGGPPARFTSLAFLNSCKTQLGDLTFLIERESHI